MKNFFITATDTGVGKTIFSAGLAAILKKRNKQIQVMKPFASGGMSDSRFIKRASQSKLSLEKITPFYFKHPLAPWSSLKLERRSINPLKLKKVFDEIKIGQDHVIVEGIGGVRVPITQKYDALDIPKQLNLGVIVVARLSLGTINHTLLTIDAIRSRKLKCLGIILNDLDAKARNIAERTNPQAIQALSGVRVLGVMPKLTKDTLANPKRIGTAIEKHIDLASFL